MRRTIFRNSERADSRVHSPMETARKSRKAMMAGAPLGLYRAL